MDLFSIASVLIVLSALFGFINVKVLKLPNTIGLMVIAIVFTLAIFASTLFTDRLIHTAEALIGRVDFQTVLLDVLLGFLLFAGAIHTNFAQLRIQRWPVVVFSTVGVLLSTFIVGGVVFFVFGGLGLNVRFIECLLFGALISPTDPIAVLGILKKANVPKKLETKIVGESLFNDGVGVVVFMTILGIAVAGSPAVGHTDRESHEINPVDVVDGPPVSAASPGTGVAEASEHVSEHGGTMNFVGVVKLFGQEVLGGLLLGCLIGYITFLMMRAINNYEIEVMITLACVMGGYSLASYLHFSAPLAIVVAGLIVGNDTVRGSAMSEQTEEYVDRFWELVDMLMNAILFVLIGLELLILEFDTIYLEAGLIAVAIVLAARFISLILPVRFFAKKLEFVPHTTTIMTWGGLRGGISIALALSLPADLNRDLFVTVTYCVVVFSIIVQGLTVGKLAQSLLGRKTDSSAAASVV